MSVVKGSQFTIYTGDGLRPIGCEESCTISFTAEEIITTTKGSGGFTNRETGRKDWSIQANGVMVIVDNLDGLSAKLDPTEFIAYVLEGKKVVGKALFTDGTIEKWLIGKGVITSANFSGQAGEFMLFDVTIKADGPLYTSANAISRVDYDGPSIYTYDAVGSVDGFTAAELINSDKIYYINRTKAAESITYLTGDVQTLAGSGSMPVGINTVGFHAASGTINFDDSLLAGNRVVVCYDPA